MIEKLTPFTLRIQEKKIARTTELEEGINFDLDKDGKIIGLEIIGALERYDQKDILNIATENLTLEKAI